MKRLTKRIGSKVFMSHDNCVYKNTSLGCNITTCYNVALNRLAEYEDAEEQGLLVRLPCKVGDTVYDISEFVERTPCPEMYEYYADYIGIGKSDDGRTVISIDCTDFYMDDFGKIVFTSREAAEKALEEVCRKNT